MNVSFTGNNFNKSKFTENENRLKTAISEDLKQQSFLSNDTHTAKVINEILNDQYKFEKKFTPESPEIKESLESLNKLLKKGLKHIDTVGVEFFNNVNASISRNKIFLYSQNQDFLTGIIKFVRSQTSLKIKRVENNMQQIQKTELLQSLVNNVEKLRLLKLK